MNAWSVDNESSYLVRPLLTANQSDGVIDYFDIKLEPEKQQTLQVEIKNNTPERKAFTVAIENAITNDHGVIEYQHEVKKYDPTLKNKFSDIAESKKIIEIDAGKSANLDVLIQMPAEEFDGIILGGIRVSEQVVETKKTGISNVFSYVVPVKIKQNDQVIPNRLNFQGVKIGQQTYENVVKAKLQNPQPEILRELTIEAKLYKKDEQKPIYEETKENMKLAPNSNFFYSISMGTNEFSAGKYRIEIQARAEALDEKWTEDFEITAKEAKEINDGMVFKKKTNWTLYILLGVLAFFITTVIFLLYRQKKHKAAIKSMERKKVSKNRKAKKKTKKMLVFLLLSSGWVFPAVALAESEELSGGSTATIHIKPQPQENTKISSEQEIKPIGNTQKQLPKTNENNSRQILYLGIFLVLSAVVILDIKKERGM